MRSERDARTQTGSRGDAGERVRRSAPVDAAGGRRAIEARRRLVVGHVVLGAGARVELWSRVTRALLRGFFGDPERIPRRLPDALAAPIARLLALPRAANVSVREASMRRACPPAILALLIAATGVGAPPPSAWHAPARYAIAYVVDLAPLASAAGGTWRVWLPVPAETAAQHVVAVDVDAGDATTRTSSDAFGNRIVAVDAAGAPPTQVVLRATVERRPDVGTPRTGHEAGTPLDPARHRAPNARIPFADVIRRLAADAARGRTTDAGRMRAFYDYVVATMRYDKSGSGWGEGDAVWACDNKRGNCTDFHSLLIGMARSQGIAARFVIGFPIPAGPAGPIPGYHCWAEWWDAERGWLPLDASEANRSGWWDAYWGALPNDRVEFSVGRDLVLAPPQAGPPLNYFIHPYAEVDGRPVAGVVERVHVTRLS
jgi:transglutaminase-like putative cysteine protease